jgi:macrolide transport system ATP-binding/permease protein
MTFWRRREQSLREKSLNEEVEDYLALETMENVAVGMTSQAAREAALRKLGNTTRIKEDTRSAWGRMWLDRLWQDLHHGCRMLRKSPGFTVVAVLSLAIGIGANSAMFSVADATLSRPLPVDWPGEVVTIGATSEIIPGLATHIATSYPDYVDLRDHSRSFDSMVAYDWLGTGYATRPDDLKKLAWVSPVTGNFFTALGVEPALGRTFRPDEDRAPGRDAVLVMSYDTWHEQFGADPSIPGKKLWVGGIEFTVIGVAPSRFTGLTHYVQPAFYVPMMMRSRLGRDGAVDPLHARDFRSLGVKARLKAGVSLAQAQQEVSTIAANLEQAHPDTNRNQRMGVYTEFQARMLQEPGDSGLGGTLLLLAVAVLLVACANVGGLMISRAPVRAREIAMRMAIGAGRPRLIRQLLTESLLIALAGGALGLVIGYQGVTLFRQIQIPSDLPIKIVIQMDQRALLVSLGVALASVILFGLIPAIQTTRTDLTSVMKARDAAPGGARLWGRSLLVAGQVTVALVLLTVAAFSYLGFRHGLAGDPGFRIDHLLSMGFDPGMAGYTPAQTEQFYKELVRRARSAPGVRNAALASYVPLTTDVDGEAIVPEGYQLPPGQESVHVNINRVDENFFDTMGVRLVAGRAFRETDDLKMPLVAIVNETVARHYWPGQSAVGKRVRWGSSNGPWVEIAGVAVTGKYVYMGESPQEFLYVPWRQHPRDHLILLAESAGSPAALAAPMREMVRTLDAAQPIFDVRTMEEIFDLRATKIASVLIQTVAFMALMGLALALVGLYGLVAYSVNRRTREIGIRIAIGASRASVLLMVLRRGLTLTLSGALVGMVASIFAGRLLETVFDNAFTTLGTVVTCLAVALAMLVVTMLAAYIPARRASRVDPTIALRYE